MGDDIDKNGVDNNKNFVYIGRKPLENPVFEVVYKSDSYVVINKPFDVNIDDDGKNRKYTVLNYIESNYPETKGNVRFVNRIDYSTSGIVFTALLKREAALAATLFQTRDTVKTYLALCNGHIQSDVEQGIINRPIAEDPIESHKMCIGTDSNRGRDAETHYKVLEIGYFTGDNRPITKVLVTPKTGRRHQIRVHLQSIGHTILGDETYGPKDSHSFRMMLHSWKLFMPFKDNPLSLETIDPFIGLIKPLL
eukprot:gene6604-8173_t